MNMLFLAGTTVSYIRRSLFYPAAVHTTFYIASWHWHDLTFSRSAARLLFPTRTPSFVPKPDDLALAFLEFLYSSWSSHNVQKPLGVAGERNFVLLLKLTPQGRQIHHVVIYRHSEMP